MHNGWFDLPGLQAGSRTIEQQMTGLDAALTECVGKSVLDLGCAEGGVALEFALAGAARVEAIECNPESVRLAREYCGKSVVVWLGNLNTCSLPRGPWDIVLALAIIHKMRAPDKLIADIAVTGAPLVVVRLPGGSTGQFTTKHHATPCNVNTEFKAHGYTLEATHQGPLDELVQYWRRKSDSATS